MSSQKIGEGHAKAMARLGLKELRNALNPSRDSVADHEIGLYGTLTQGEIARDRGGPGSGAEQEGAPGATPATSLEEMRAQSQPTHDEQTLQREQGRER